MRLWTENIGAHSALLCHYSCQAFKALGKRRNHTHESVTGCDLLLPRYANYDKHKQIYFGSYRRFKLFNLIWLKYVSLCISFSCNKWCYSKCFILCWLPWHSWSHALMSHPDVKTSHLKTVVFAFTISFIGLCPLSTCYKHLCVEHCHVILRINVGCFTGVVLWLDKFWHNEQNSPTTPHKYTQSLRYLSQVIPCSIKMFIKVSSILKK